jgi:hypothetical protein
VVLPQDLVGKAYYEILFWGGGHALQFTWTLLMLVGWLWLASICGARLPISPRLTVLMFVLALASVFVTPYAYLAHDVATVEHRNLHTWAMRLGGGIAIAPIALAVVMGLWSARRGDKSTRPLRAALVSSMALFAAGGLIGAMINGSNVKIPAHYHGCIVGVTLAFMGLVYHLLPRLGYGAVHGRMATLQPYLYGAGQLLHIIGLVWSGGYGVQRKVAGSEQVLRSTAEVFGMGLMGLGGLVAISVAAVRARRSARCAARPRGVSASGPWTGARFRDGDGVPRCSWSSPPARGCGLPRRLSLGMRRLRLYRCACAPVSGDGSRCSPWSSPPRLEASCPLGPARKRRPPDRPGGCGQIVGAARLAPPPPRCSSRTCWAAHGLALAVGMAAAHANGAPRPGDGGCVACRGRRHGRRSATAPLPTRRRCLVHRALSWVSLRPGGSSP